MVIASDTIAGRRPPSIRHSAPNRVAGKDDAALWWEQFVEALLAEGRLEPLGAKQRVSQEPRPRRLA
jgi:hypothetical protein